MTQAELAEKLCVSDKTISKWGTAKGYPDISLLEPIEKVFGVSITELISGNAINNVNVSANMLRSNFYVCPVCGNTIHEEIGKCDASKPCGYCGFDEMVFNNICYMENMTVNGSYLTDNESIEKYGTTMAD